jgi:hypothetical protein
MRKTENVATPVTKDHRIETSTDGRNIKHDTCGHCAKEIIWDYIYLTWRHWDGVSVYHTCK